MGNPRPARRRRQKLHVTLSSEERAFAEERAKLYGVAVSRIIGAALRALKALSLEAAQELVDRAAIDTRPPRRPATGGDF